MAAAGPAGAGQAVPPEAPIRAAVQMMGQIARVRAGLALRRVGPELEGQVVARLRRVAVEDEVGRERLQASLVDARHGLVAVDETELPRRQTCRIFPGIALPPASGICQKPPL